MQFTLLGIDMGLGAYNVLMSCFETTDYMEETTISQFLIFNFHATFYILQVMCPTCLCTGMAMASEHDPRIDPFD